MRVGHELRGYDRKQESKANPPIGSCKLDRGGSSPLSSPSPRPLSPSRPQSRDTAGVRNAVSHSARCWINLAAGFFRAGPSNTAAADYSHFMVVAVAKRWTPFITGREKTAQTSHRCVFLLEKAHLENC